MSRARVSIALGSIPCETGLAEGPHWDAEREELLYVDVVNHCAFRYLPREEECHKVEIDSLDLSLIVPVAREPYKYIIAAERTIQLIEWDGISATPDEAKLLHTVDDEMPTNRLNDGKCDANGRLWAGSMGEFHVQTGKINLKRGSLYSFEGVLPEVHFGDIDIANGLTWSPDNSVMYYIDSNSGRLDAYDFNLESGTLSNRRTAYNFKSTGTLGLADGMTIDANGNVWVAMFGGQGVVQIDPRVGKQISVVEMYANRVTSVAFGGTNLDTLYITTAGAFMPNDKLEDFGLGAGQLYQAVNVGAKGLAGGVSYAGII